MHNKLPTRKIKNLEQLFKALSHKNRLAIISYLKDYQHASVGSISESVGTTLHNTSKHLIILEKAGIVTHIEDGTYRMYWLVKHNETIINYIVGKL